MSFLSNPVQYSRDWCPAGPAPRGEDPNAAHNKRVIADGGYCVIMPYGLESISTRRIHPNDCGRLGSDPACNMDLIDAVDVGSYVEQGVKWGFKQRGAVYHLPSHDANGAAITSRAAAPVPLRYYYTSGGDCVTWIDRVPSAGKLLLARTGHPPSGGSPGVGAPAPAPRLVCNLSAKLRPGDRAERNGASNINLRNAPGLGGAKVGSIQAGTVVQVLDGPRSANGFKWYKIRTAGRAEGWVAESGNAGGKCDYYFVKTSKSVRDPGGSPGRNPDDPIDVNSRCSLHDAIEAANKDRRVGGCPAGDGGDTINLRQSVTLSRSLPNISSTIAINGSNHSISGDNSRSILTVDKGATLRLNRVTLRNGYMKDSRGAALVNHGATTIIGSYITGNRVGKDGGAISNKGTLTINNSRFTDNQSSESGGAIRNDGTLAITFSTFRNNKASEPGGAIRNKGALRIAGGKFSGNTGENGGAISNKGTATISSVNFEDNSATCVGGAIEHSGDSITVTSSNSFSGNSPEACHGADCGSGAAKPVKEINYNLIRQGELGCSSAYELYSFSGKKDEIVKISMERESGTIAPALSLWNSSGEKLAEDANTRTDRDALIANYKLPADGTYTISANNYHDGAGSYFLVLRDETTYVLPEHKAKEVAEDLRGFYTQPQLDAAEETVVYWAIVTCDMISTAGFSIGTTAAKQLAKEVIKEFIKDRVFDLVKRGIAWPVRLTADGVREAQRNGLIRSLVPAALLEAVVDLVEKFPTGPCSTGEFTTAAMDLLIGDALLEYLEAESELADGICEISSSDTVLAYSWPNADGTFIGQAFASDGLRPVGFVQLSGAPKFYLLTGKFGSKASIIGQYDTAVFGGAEDRGAAFVPEDAVEATESCGSLIDMTDFLGFMTSPQPGEHANPYVFNIPDPESGNCDLTVDGYIKFYDNWGDAMSPPISLTNPVVILDIGAHNHRYRVYKMTKFPNQEGRGSVYVRRVLRHIIDKKHYVSDDPTFTGWLVTKNADIDWHPHSSAEKCLRDFDSGFFGQLGI